MRLDSPWPTWKAEHNAVQESMTTDLQTGAPSGAPAPLRHRTRRRIESVLTGLGLRVHPDKTRIVFLGDGVRTASTSWGCITKNLVEVRGSPLGRNLFGQIVPDECSDHRGRRPPSIRRRAHPRRQRGLTRIVVITTTRANPRNVAAAGGFSPMRREGLFRTIESKRGCHDHLTQIDDRWRHPTETN